MLCQRVTRDKSSEAGEDNWGSFFFYFFYFFFIFFIGKGLARWSAKIDAALQYEGTGKRNCEVKKKFFIREGKKGVKAGKTGKETE